MSLSKYLTKYFDISLWIVPEIEKPERSKSDAHQKAHPNSLRCMTGSIRKENSFTSLWESQRVDRQDLQCMQR